MENKIENPKVRELITSLAGDFKDEVVKIESGIKTTQDHYGRYMALLSTMNQGKSMTQILALALIEAGANQRGVASAYKILFP